MDGSLAITLNGAVSPTDREPITGGDFRRAMRCWASGVTVVTVGEVEGVSHGLTVSAFTSVSLEPPTVLVCINGRSRAHGLLRDRACFAVNILAADQRDVSEHFARARGDCHLAPFAHRRGAVLPCPVLEGALAVLECLVIGSVEVGDHSTYFGRVEAAESSDREPLLYYGACYR
jgi:flavin reductase (DIM6/NTAB) family NADH-FMN oxidoreductase RutF